MSDWLFVGGGCVLGVGVYVVFWGGDVVCGREILSRGERRRDGLGGCAMMMDAGGGDAVRGLGEKGQLGGLY